MVKTTLSFPIHSQNTKSKGVKMINTKSILCAALLLSLASCSRVPRTNIKQEVVQCPTSTSTTTTTTTVTTTTTTSTTATTELTTTTEPPITTIATEIEPVTVAEETVCGGDINYVEPLSGYWEGTYYTATAMGYTSQPYGASGELLTSGYSVASNYFPFGTMLYIESDYISGVYIVQDCGGMANNVIDFYFWDSSEVPAGFRQAGRVPITIVPIQ